jgi:hypothetical protein
VFDTVVRQNVLLSDTIISYVLDPVQELAGWKRFRVLASEIMSPRTQTNSKEARHKAARVFTSSIFFIYGAPAHIGPWPPLMRFLNLTLIDSW